MTTPITQKIILNNVSFRLSNTSVVFKDVNLSFENAKYGITGRNGTGKSTFLKLLTGDLHPNSGSIQQSGCLVTVPQNHASIAFNASIADVLGITHILQALDRINASHVDEADFEIMADQWDIEKRIEAALAYFNLRKIDLEKPFHDLSGGQKTKILLAKTLILPSDFLIFDEPTNNLDTESRQILYQYIQESSKAMIMASHDRELLNLCDKIVEINANGVEMYGGGYDFYKEQKENKSQAIHRDLQTQTEILNKAKKTVQNRVERHQQGEAKGKKEKVAQIKAKGSYDKIVLKAQKGRSEKTNRRIRVQADRKLESINEKLSQVSDQLESFKELDFCLDATRVPTKKNVISIENLVFHYDDKTPLFEGFNFSLSGPGRIALQGANGSGKSTLIKLILGLLKPKSGQIQVSVENVAYLDQNVGCLDPDLSLVENFLEKHLNAKPFDAYRSLAFFQFRNKEAEKKVKVLSGGEKIRAGLAMSLMSIPAPQLIILDEPTNHLDLDSILAIETALKAYQGGLIVVSHDEDFLNEIGVQRRVDLG